jgi:hypothetical protein
MVSVIPVGQHTAKVIQVVKNAHGVTATLEIEDKRFIDKVDLDSKRATFWLNLTEEFALVHIGHASRGTMLIPRIVRVSKFPDNISPPKKRPELPEYRERAVITTGWYPATLVTIDAGKSKHGNFLRWNFQVMLGSGNCIKLSAFTVAEYDYSNPRSKKLYAWAKIIGATETRGEFDLALGLGKLVNVYITGRRNAKGRLVNSISRLAQP